MVPPVWKELESDQKVSSQELSLLELGSYQDISACLVEASRKVSQLQLVD